MINLYRFCVLGRSCKIRSWLNLLGFFVIIFVVVWFVIEVFLVEFIFVNNVVIVVFDIVKNWLFFNVFKNFIFIFFFY